MKVTIKVMCNGLGDHTRKHEVIKYISFWCAVHKVFAVLIS